jgi:hypothetical protein
MVIILNIAIYDVNKLFVQHSNKTQVVIPEVQRQGLDSLLFFS